MRAASQAPMSIAEGMAVAEPSTDNTGTRALRPIVLVLLCDRLCYRHTLSLPSPLSHAQSVAFVRFPSLVTICGPLSCEIGGSGALPGEHRLTVGICTYGLLYKEP